MPIFSGRWAYFFEDLSILEHEIHFPRFHIGCGHNHPNRVSQPIGPPCVQPDQGIGALVVFVMIIVHIPHMDAAFHKHFPQLDEDAEPRHPRDHPFKRLTEVLKDILHLFQLDTLPFRLHRCPFTL